MKKLINLLLVTIALATSGSAFAGAHDGGGGPKAAGDGHCDYVMENMFAGPFKVCQMPTDAALCEEFGNTDDNTDAVQGEGECSMEAAVGVCDMGISKMVYFTSCRGARVGGPVCKRLTRRCRCSSGARSRSAENGR